MFFYLIPVILLCSDFVSAKLPQDIQKCSPLDNGCLATSMKYVLTTYPTGNAGLNMDSIDPLKIEAMSIIQGGSQSPVRANMNFTDILLYGIKDSKVLSIKPFGKLPTENNDVFEINVHTPGLVMIGTYIMDGSILILPITGTGKSNITLSNVNVFIRYKASSYLRGKKNYIHMDRFKFTFTTEKATFHFTNLFGGNKVLGDNMNNFMNENWKTILDELQPSITKAYSAVFGEIFNRIFSKLSVDDIYLE